MTFLLLHNNVIIGQTDSPVEALSHLSQMDTGLAETVVSGADPRTAIPGELDRAITAWNAMADRINIHVDKVKTGAQYVAPYRKWVKAAGRRDYFLEQLIVDVEAQPYIWTTIRFGWLLRSVRTKDGELNSEKIHARAYGKGGNGNGQISHHDYLVLAGRVAAFQKYHVDGASFEEATGVSWHRFEELRKRFNGGANVT